MGLYNKLLIVILLVAIAAGLALVGPRQVLVSRGVLAAIGIALVVGVPNILYQAVNSWPQLSFGRQLADHNAGSVRTSMWPLLLLLLGPGLAPVWISGLVALWRRPDWRPIRFLAAAFPVLLVVVFVLGSQPYYPFGLVGMLFAFGCVPTWEWLQRGGRTRRIVSAAGVGASTLVGLVISLPLIPVSDVGHTPVPALNQAARDTVGWPTYVREVAAAYRSIPPSQRAHTIVYASNYGEAGALDRYGPALGLPTTYSAQNQLYYQARPPKTATTVVLVGGQTDYAETMFTACHPAGTLDNHLAVDNEEQHEPIAICHGPTQPWTVLWPQLKHED